VKKRRKIKEQFVFNSMLDAFLITTAWCFLRLQMEETASNC
jgi:hypothetical protein